MTDTIDRREYGKLEATVEQLSRDVVILQKTVETMRDLMQNAMGGWRMLMLVGSFAAALGAFGAWALSHITFK